VDQDLILETTFLVDLERELSRDVIGPAHAFLASRPDARLHITPVVAGELAAGTSLSSRQRWEEFVMPFRILDLTRDVSWAYGRAYRHLADNGLLIGANDLWIAAAGLAYGFPVVTRNVRHYRRVPGLEVAEYAPVP
jgi:tRNA(fMet)-specific endonuclease VapC